ncbi:Orn/DAP/Arg decarboxylase 2, partial [Scheffersomyces stipitis CBS 6054]
AKRSLMATSLVTCMDNSQITPLYFNVTFNPDDGSLRYALDLTTDISTYVVAHLQVYAYGFLIIERDIDMCSLGWPQFCPVFPGSLQIDSIEYISNDVVSSIPGIAYTVPDIDAVAKVIVKDRDTKQTLTCLQASFSNGKTISQTGAKWATAVIAGLGLLIAAILSTFGNSNAASHISANSVSLFLYFQSVVVVCMQHVERVPPIASAWSENLAWSMGLIRVGFMQKIFRWYVQSTGGNPTQYFSGTTKQILVQRSLDYVNGIRKRALDFALKSNSNLFVLRGIKRIGFNSFIEPTSIVVTGFTFFIIVGYLLVLLLVVTKSVLDLLIRFKRLSPSTLTTFRLQFPVILKGSILRYIYIGFTQLVILSLWEFTQQDSPAVIVLAVLFLLLPLSVIGYSYWMVIKFGKESIKKYNNPAAMLYGDNRILDKYGYCYTMFHADKYWFGVVLIGYNLLKAIFIGLLQTSGKASVVILFVIDLAYTIYLIYTAPYLNKPTNILSYVISVVVTANSFLFLFFSDLFGQPAPVASIMGWVFFILNAAFSLVLLVFILVFIVMSVISKNPDARFAPARDDRFSFQRKSSMKRRSFIDEKQLSDEDSNQARSGGDELAALGVAAQDHSTDWEAQMYKLNNLSGEGASSQNEISSNREFLTP